MIQLGVMLGQILLSLSLALLAGSFLLLAVPKTHRPVLSIPSYVVVLAVLGLVIGTFIPVIQVALALTPRLSLIAALEMVLTSFRIGIAWDFTLLGGVLLIISYVLFQNRSEKLFQIGYLIITVFLVGTVAWASHASSISPVRGFIGDFLHLLAAAIWVGVVVIIGWFAVSTDNWKKWLKWFSPVAFVCFLTMGLSGFLLMDLLVPNYVTGLSTSYGQGLFIKQLLMIPLIAYIVINSFFMKRWMETKKLNPVPWVRAESIILFAIFMVTAYFSHQPPPSTMVFEHNLSALSTWFLNESVQDGMQLGFQVGASSLFFAMLALVFGGLVVASFVKRAPLLMGAVMSVAAVGSAYLGVMSGLTVV